MIRYAIACLPLFLLSFLTADSQNCETQQVKLKGGQIVFSVCKSDMSISYKDNLEYYWYSDFSGVQTTKGGSSGKLLHGKYQEFWPNGKLHFETQYTLGLENGVNKEWDERGEMFATMKYKMGVIVYSKQKNDDGYWIEFKGPLLQPKSERNVYDQTGILLEKWIYITSVDVKVFKYYEYPDSGIVRLRYTENSILHWLSDTFVSYYNNGKIQAIGKMSNDSKDGVWKYYDERGKLTGIESYRIHKEYYATGKLRLSGGEFYDEKTEMWIKHGRWIWWQENGEFPQRDLKYELGEIVNEDD